MIGNKDIPVEDIGLLVHQPLINRKIILGLSASSSIYRSVDLARKLIRMGASLRVVMTKAATKLIGPDLMHWATGSKPLFEMTGETEHIDLAKWGEALVVAPATLNTMSKIAHGILDELLTLTAVTMLGEKKKVIVVPAMNIRLYKSPQYQKAHKALSESGVVVIPPHIVEDKAKYPPLEDLAHCIDAIVNRGLDLAGRSVLVTAGATREYIDPVRIITNPSSGLMGILVAREAACRGARVVMIHGSTSVETPYMVERVYADTTEEMANVVSRYTEDNVFDIAVFAAAPADYKPVEVMKSKISTRMQPELRLELTPTPKVIKSVRKKPRFTVGFAAETTTGDELYAKASEKLRDYSLDLVVANNVSSSVAGFGKEFLEALIIESDGIVAKGILTKYEIARLIIDTAVKRLRGL